MGYQVGAIGLVEVRRQQYLKERERLNGHEMDPVAAWRVIAAADNLAEAIELAG